MTRNKGFTLIEILIVIVIIGITAGFALIAFGDFGQSKKILFAVEQLQSTLKLTQQQAILETGTFGLRIDNSNYQILKFKNPSSWNPISNKGIFKVYNFPKNTSITLKTSFRSKIGTPSIIINSSGDITPFTLNFDTTNDESVAILTGYSNGDIKLTMAKPK